MNKRGGNTLPTPFGREVQLDLVCDELLDGVNSLQRNNAEDIRTDEGSNTAPSDTEAVGADNLPLLFQPLGRAPCSCMFPGTAALCPRACAELSADVGAGSSPGPTDYAGDGLEHRSDGLVQHDYQWEDQAREDGWPDIDWDE